ncbi:MAG: hypothetical protein M1814_004646 [Vezdaea aestivalis]|nr:MAG: hypothetical protein M1814_004646 [Vezdaea aestivalis]
MADPISQASTSLLTEHLRYHPLSLIDDIINSVNSLVYRAVSAVEAGLLSTPPAHLGFAKKAAVEKVKPPKDENGKPMFPEAKLEIENGVHQLETLLEATVDKDFDKLELYVLRNVLHIPSDLAPWVRLKHYENLDFTPSDDTPTPSTIQTLHSTLRETEKLQSALTHESARNKALLSHLRALLSPQPTSTSTPSPDDTSLSLSFLSASPLPAGASAPTPLTTAATFLTSQLPALRSLLTTLRPKISSVALPVVVSGVDEAGDREARNLYVETQTRRHLVRARGVEFTNEGEVRDGGWVGGGRGVEGVEVKALEEIVSGFEGAKRGRGGRDAMEEE